MSVGSIKLATPALHSKQFPMLVTRGPTLPMVRWSHPTSADPAPVTNTPGESCLSQGILQIPQPILRPVTTQHTAVR